MQPLGRKPIRFPRKMDHMFHKPFKNWWETIGTESKKRDRRKAKEEIRKASK